MTGVRVMGSVGVFDPLDGVDEGVRVCPGRLVERRRSGRMGCCCARERGRA